MLSSAAATRSALRNCRKELSSVTIGTLIAAAFAFGKIVPAHRSPSGVLFRAMLIYFLQHGEADWPDWKKPDDERPLTEKGKKEMHEVGASLANLSVKPDVDLTSPLPRAWQTAEIAAHYIDAKCVEEKSLAPGFGRSELRKLLKKRSYTAL